MASLRPPQTPQPADTLKVPLPGMMNPGAMTSTTGPAPASTYTPPPVLSGPLFTGHAPTATPYGDFVPPNPAALASDPYTQFRLAEGQRGLEHSAAAHGTLLSGGLLRSLERYRQGVASEEAGKSFERALEAYRANRDTNAQNFGQSNTQFRGDLDIFGANRGAPKAGVAGPPVPEQDIDPRTGLPRVQPSPLVYGPSQEDYITQVQSARDTGMRAPLPAMAPTPFPFRYREARSY